MVTSTPTISRQRPGSACEECRRRKVRCDRRRPQCQVCFETGIECKINTTRLPRGPRKGQLRTLRTRIAALERCLADQHPEINHQMASLFDGTVLDCDSEDDPFRDLTSLSDSIPVSVPFSALPDPVLAPVEELETRERDAHPTISSTKIQSPRTPESLPRSTGLVSELMRAELDQLYFDRVHPFAPILQRWRYHVWARQPKKSDSQVCLQYAMWTVAASLSAQFQALRDQLYTETRRILDSLDRPDSITMVAGLEQAQAWILIGLYEYMQRSALQAWMSIGRCCRLVLGMRLYELDDSTNPVTMAREQEAILVDWIGLEEQRRTFWMAYSLDRFIGFHNGLPFTLHEPVITTRLPSPEEEFQCGQPTLTPYLREVMSQHPHLHHPVQPNLYQYPHLHVQQQQHHPHIYAIPHSPTSPTHLTMAFPPVAVATPTNPTATTTPVLNPDLNSQVTYSNSSFTEFILLATIVGRALSHRQALVVEQPFQPFHHPPLSPTSPHTPLPNSLETFWNRHHALHAFLSARIQSLSSNPQALDDPLIMFARIVAQSMVLFLHNVLESVAWKSGGDQLLGIIEDERLCVLAAHEVVGLVKVQGQLGYFKVHPLTPIPLMMCTEFLTAHAYLDPSFEVMLHELLECLGDLERVKNPVQSPTLSVVV
ncbi:fungal specific transcription factor domain-containing protein [Aspergillus fijiensis CBS 313.89]|uniref:Fungal-specific transcription factor domain protein n=1 Tax=Aspergillus fijiensis CBS 313.89 TaxID=1448319 RepID=A0A8G1RGH9_9EURO|nr:fungal-specific transcription factor domain protein [Aspergillus fijiensis CBS 313.89]RAK71380.1 fungal-specific transcription factor domain protein [Aspergillus fijiensis CBS 313.89]